MMQEYNAFYGVQQGRKETGKWLKRPLQTGENWVKYSKENSGVIIFILCSNFFLEPIVPYLPADWLEPTTISLMAMNIA